MISHSWFLQNLLPLINIRGREGCVVLGTAHSFLLGILIFKGLTVLRLYKLFGVKGLILIAFPQQKLLRVSASVFHYKYTAYPYLFRFHDYCRKCPFYCVSEHTMSVAPKPSSA
jgi:hypothetical protein